MKKYLWLTTLFLTSISFAAQLSPVTTEDDFRCEYYQTKNNKTPIGKAIGVSTIGDEEFLYLGLDGKKLNLNLQIITLILIFLLGKVEILLLFLNS